ncbi:MAG: SH3 domain-containing protein [Clostridiales bacterium]|nr:SH3 domain-containing protein [Clostridiales bacterium]
MFFNRYRTVSLILAASAAASLLCSCSFDTPQSAETSLPTTVATTQMSETTTVAAETTEPAVETTAATDTVNTYETAVDSYAIDTEYVRLVDGVEPEMMSADYWIGEDDNIVLMNDKEIATYNYENRAVIKASDGETVYPHLDEFGDTLDGDILRTFLNDNAASIPDYPPRYYLDGVRTDYLYWQNLIDLSNIDAVEDEIKVQYAYTVKRMTLRMFPTEDRVFDGPDDQYFDCILYAECMPYMPCVVLHQSSDGEYLYVVFDSYAAWVRKDAVAFCRNREDWVERQNPDKWLIVTAREIRLGNDPYSEATTNLVLPMGTQMELVPVGEAPDVINQRTTYGDYVVKVPTRGRDGYIVDEYVLIPVSDDVHAGYLSLTPANIVRQALKLLGDRYGWGGDLQANDCTGITREIYRCFGILLPRVGQSNSKGVCKTDLSEMDNDEKLAVIEELTPGSLISFPGHMMIYLGTVNGVPYVISATGTFVAPEPGPTEKIHPDTVIITSLYVRRANLSTWLDTAAVAMTITPEK